MSTLVLQFTVKTVKIYYIRYWKDVFLRTLFNCPSSFGNPIARNNLNMKKESVINVLSQVKSSRVEFHLNSHRILIQFSCFKYENKRLCLKETKFLNFRFIVQGLGHLNSSYK